MKQKRCKALKICKEFFHDEPIEKLSNHTDGDMLITLYLKMMLKTMDNDLCFHYSGTRVCLEDEIAAKIEEPSRNVRRTIKVLLFVGLAEYNGDTLRMHETEHCKVSEIITQKP